MSKKRVNFFWCLFKSMDFNSLRTFLGMLIGGLLFYLENGYSKWKSVSSCQGFKGPRFHFSHKKLTRQKQVRNHFWLDRWVWFFTMMSFIKKKNFDFFFFCDRWSSGPGGRHLDVHRTKSQSWSGLSRTTRTKSGPTLDHLRTTWTNPGPPQDHPDQVRTNPGPPGPSQDQPWTTRTISGPRVGPPLTLTPTLGLYSNPT
jgi:hypothetical protein